jgi:hypothetical protein
MLRNTLPTTHPHPQQILRQHATNRLPQHLSAAPLRHHAVHTEFFEGAGPRGMCAVQFLEALFAGGVQVGAVDGYDVVAAVGAGVEDGLVFSHEDDGDGGGDAAEGAGVGADVDEVPGAGVREARLGSIVRYGI